MTKNVTSAGHFTGEFGFWLVEVKEAQELPTPRGRKHCANPHDVAISDGDDSLWAPYSALFSIMTER
jgi:hypothetical protein